MPIGVNGGGQLNIIVFEVGWITRDEFTGIEVVTTVSVHPLVVGPRSIVYADTSRSQSTRTLGGSHTTIGGRDLRSVVIDGTFGGQATKGLAGYVGNNEVLFRRFYNEVIRMGEALSQADVDAAVDVLTGSLGIWLSVETYDPQRSTPYINFYDFWKDRAFACTIPSWRDTSNFMGGGSTGVIQYQMQVREAGPLVVGGLGEQLISTLLAGLTFLDSLSNVIETYTVSNLLDSFLAVAAIGASELSDLVDAAREQVASMQGLLSGQPQLTDPTIASVFTTLKDLSDTCEALAAQLDSQRGDQALPDGGAVDWENAPGEGTQLDVEAFTQSAELQNLADTAASQARAGAYFGMDQPTFETYVSSGGATRGPDVSGTLRHSVGPFDTLATLESRYGVSAELILALNGLLPDEAVVTGISLLIPRLRRAGAPSAISGLPTFGSHVGTAAWGCDFTADLTAGPDGDFSVVSESACVEQGIAILVEELGPSLLPAINAVPEPARASYLQKVYGAAMLTDRRVRSVVSIVASQDSTAWNVDVTLGLVNGGQVRFGGTDG